MLYPTSQIRQHLVSVEKEEGNHEGEQAGSFGKGETKDGKREELACSARGPLAWRVRP